MTKEEFFAITMPSEPDKAALASEILERAWKVVEQAVLEVAWLDQQLWEKRITEEVELGVMNSIGVVMKERLTSADAQVFWANQRQMGKRRQRSDAGIFSESSVKNDLQSSSMANLVVVSDEVKDRDAATGTMLNPEIFPRFDIEPLRFGGCDPVRLIMLSPSDLKRVRAGELEVTEAFGINWVLVYPQDTL